MAVEVQLVEPTHALAEALAPRLRAADVKECLAACGEGPLASLLGSLERSIFARAALFDGEIAAMWGVAPVPEAPGCGAAWLLGGEALTRHPLVFWRLCRPELRELARFFPVLFNFVDARYEAALRWARRLGFEIHPARPLGPLGLPFHPIVFRRD